MRTDNNKILCVACAWGACFSSFSILPQYFHPPPFDSSSSFPLNDFISPLPLFLVHDLRFRQQNVSSKLDPNGIWNMPPLLVTHPGHNSVKPWHVQIRTGAWLIARCAVHWEMRRMIRCPCAPRASPWSPHISWILIGEILRRKRGTPPLPTCSSTIFAVLSGQSQFQLRLVAISHR